MVLLPMLVFKILRVPSSLLTSKHTYMVGWREISGEREREREREPETESEESSFNFAKKRTLPAWLWSLSKVFLTRETVGLSRKIIFSLLVRPFSNLISKPRTARKRRFQGPWPNWPLKNRLAAVTARRRPSILNEAI